MPVLNRDTERLGVGVFSTFPQPSTIGVIPHIVEDAAPWPAEVQAIADAFTKGACTSSGCFALICSVTSNVERH